MVEADDVSTTTTSFPVVLFDGEREINVGNISVHPSLVFKEFQMKLSQLIGISYNNITTYLVDSKKSKISTDRRKVLITGKANFASLVRETNCYFLVVLKRSRRERRRKPVAKQTDSGFGFGFHFAPNLTQISPNWNRNYLNNLNNLNEVRSESPDLLQMNWNRNRELDDASMCVPNRYYYDDRFGDLVMRNERENYMNMILNDSGYGYGFESNSTLNFPEYAYPRVPSDSNCDSDHIWNNNSNHLLCEECAVARKQGKDAEFHLCVYDEVVVGFRSRAGPVSRPKVR